MINIIGAITVDLVAGMTGQFLALGTTIHLFIWIEQEIRNSEESWLGSGSLAAVKALLETFLLGKARIAFSELNVGDVSIDLFIRAHSQAVKGMIIAVRGQLLALKVGFIFSDGDDVFFLHQPAAA